MSATFPLHLRHRILLALLLLAGLVSTLWWHRPPQPRVWFDPQQIAPHAFHDPANVAVFVQALQAEFPVIDAHKALFVRFVQPDCPCEKLVNDYHQLLVPVLQKQGMQVISLPPAKMKALNRHLADHWQEWVPSTPAILLLDDSQQLIYFGPYHQEGVCNSENSYLEPILDTLQRGRSPRIINTLVEGCFCPYPVN